MVVVSRFEVHVWDALAQQAAERLTKGTKVVVSGRLKEEKWQDNSGQQRFKIVVRNDISMHA